MLDMMKCEIIPDDEMVFYDGFLYIISRIKDGYLTDKEFVESEYKIDVIALTPPYTEPLTLKDIAEKYPKVQKVIFDDAMRGYVYNYGNHRNETYKDGSKSEMWELVGTTLGYA